MHIIKNRELGTILYISPGSSQTDPFISPVPAMRRYRVEERTIAGDAPEKKQTFFLVGNDVRNDARSSGDSAWTTDAMTVLKTTFLPVGYPNSVRAEYITYQYWDSIQGMSSYLRSVLTTRSVLAGAGVGSAETTALAAALSWVFRDGLGMIGSLLFAYKYASTFEVYIKEWRYLADVLNNVGLTLDLLSADFPRYYLTLTSISTLCKACCGLIAGATKARISAHFAMPGHLADVTAKESTQETAVALVGLVVGMVLAQLIGNDDRSVWITFTVLLLIHQYSNYHLVKVLVFSNLNPQRCYLLAKHSAAATQSAPGSLAAQSTRSTIADLPTPSEIARQEGFFTPIYLSYFGPEVGTSLSNIIETIQFIVCHRSGTFINDTGWDVRRTPRAESCYDFHRPRVQSVVYSNVGTFFSLLATCWEEEQFLVGVNMNGRVVVSLKDGVTNGNIVKAYMVAYYMYVKLDVTVLMYGAKPTSKHAYLTELYSYIVGSLAAEALHWYDTFAQNNSALIVGNDDGAGNKKEHEKGHTLVSSDESPHVQAVIKSWDLCEIASLTVSEWRYSDVVVKEE